MEETDSCTAEAIPQFIFVYHYIVGLIPTSLAEVAAVLNVKVFRVSGGQEFDYGCQALSIGSSFKFFNSCSRCSRDAGWICASELLLCESGIRIPIR